MRILEMVSYPRAKIATVRIGHLEFEGLMLPDGTFGIAVPQICSVFSFLNKNAQRDIQSLLNEPSPFLKWSSKLNSKAVNVLLLPSFERLIFRLALKQNKVAISLSEQLIGLPLQQLFSDAFCIQFEKEERQRWLEDRGKKTTLAQLDKYFDPYSRLEALNFSVELKQAVITELQKYFVSGTYLAILSSTEDSTKIEFVICHSCSIGQQYYSLNYTNNKWKIIALHNWTDCSCFDINNIAVDIY
jgi:hypothetical protein